MVQKVELAIKEFDFFGTHFSGSNPDWETTFFDWNFSMNSGFLILFDTNLKHVCYNKVRGENYEVLKILRIN